ncbi:MAG: hypothetical protein RIG62_24485 [Cyclobacteriaceae bacterium]
MKNLIVFIAPALLLASCYEDHSDIIPGQDFIPDEILAKIEENGQPIFEGLTPPKVEGIFKSEPYVLVSSNFDDSYAYGDQFGSLVTEFTEFNRKSLTLKVNIEQGGSAGEGYGSFISGLDDNFTIYVKVNRDYGEISTIEARVYSGTLTENGIYNLYVSIFMIDDGDDPADNLIEVGQGRLFEDEDGFSEKVN